MLLLLLSTQKEQYAMDTDNIVEVIPYLHLQSIPMTPGYVLGAVNYKGTPVPVVDLSLILDGTSCEMLHSTRIILVEIAFDAVEGKKTIGLLAEKVTETIKTPKGWRPKAKVDKPYFIESSVVGRDMIQWFEPILLLPQDLNQKLFMEQQ